MPADEAVDLDRRVRVDELHEVLQADLRAEIDQEQRQQLGQATEDRGVDVAGEPQRGLVGLLGERDEEADEPGRTGSVASASETVTKTP